MPKQLAGKHGSRRHLVDIVLSDHGAVHDDGIDSLGLRDDAVRAARKVVHARLAAMTDLGRIEDDDIRWLTHFKGAAVGDPEHLSRALGQHVNGVLKRKRSAISHKR